MGGSSRPLRAKRPGSNLSTMFCCSVVPEKNRLYCTEAWPWVTNLVCKVHFWASIEFSCFTSSMNISSSVRSDRSFFVNRGLFYGLSSCKNDKPYVKTVTLTWYWTIPFLSLRWIPVVLGNKPICPICAPTINRFVQRFTIWAVVSNFHLYSLLWLIINCSKKPPFFESPSTLSFFSSTCRVTVAPRDQWEYLDDNLFLPSSQ